MLVVDEVLHRRSNDIFVDNFGGEPPATCKAQNPVTRQPRHGSILKTCACTMSEMSALFFLSAEMSIDQNTYFFRKQAGRFVRSDVGRLNAASEDSHVRAN